MELENVMEFPTDLVKAPPLSAEVIARRNLSDAMFIIVKLAKDPSAPPSVRLAAALEIVARAEGKPGQQMPKPAPKPVNGDANKLSVEELQQEIARLRAEMQGDV